MLNVVDLGFFISFSILGMLCFSPAEPSPLFYLCRAHRNSWPPFEAATRSLHPLQSVMEERVQLNKSVSQSAGHTASGS